MYSRTLETLQRGEWFLGGNHVVGGSKINKKILWLRETSVQCMASLMIFSLVSRIKLPMTFGKGNIVLFKLSRHLVYGFIHTCVLRMIPSLEVWALGIFKPFVPVLLKTWGSVWRILPLLRSDMRFIFICFLFVSLWIAHYVNALREGIRQFGVVSIPEWKVEMNSKNYGPILLRMKRTNCNSSF